MNVNWELWADLPTVQLWEAVSLSLEIEPKRLRGYDHASTRDPIFRFPFAACSTEFKRRLEIATQHLGRSLLVDLLLEPAWESQVKLQDVSQWAGSLNSPWTFPEKFSKLNADLAVGNIVPAGQDSKKTPDIASPDYSVLANPEQLLAAFRLHGLKKNWFNDLSNHPWLNSAKQVMGKSGRGGFPPYFCPYKVMLGLLNKSRSSRLTEERAWQILETEFPHAYAKFEIGKPDFGQSEKPH